MTHTNKNYFISISLRCCCIFILVLVLRLRAPSIAAPTLKFKWSSNGVLSKGLHLSIILEEIRRKLKIIQWIPHDYRKTFHLLCIFIFRCVIYAFGSTLNSKYNAHTHKCTPTHVRAHSHVHKLMYSVTLLMLLVPRLQANHNINIGISLLLLPLPPSIAALTWWRWCTGSVYVCECSSVCQRRRTTAATVLPLFRR